MKRKHLAVLLIFLFAAPIIGAVPRLAGGRIEGRVTDPKGAVIVSATVTATESVTNHTFTAITDERGHYKLDGLTAGIYSITVSAKGFGDAQKQDVKVEDGALTSVDVRLEIAAVEANVEVTTAGAKPNTDPIYHQLREQAKSEQDFAGSYATVNNFVLKRDAATFTLSSGELYFLSPVEGHVTGAVFIGDGQLTLVPPTEIEKHSLKLFTEQPGIDEPFSNLVLRFTDKTFDEVKTSSSARMSSGGAHAGRARDLYRENQRLLRKQLRENRELRTLEDLYAPDHPGFFQAFIDGKHYNKLVYLLDPQGVPEVSPEEVLLRSYGDTDGGYWTAFHLAGEYLDGTAVSSQDHRLVDLTHHEIDASIKGATITATDHITFRAIAAGTRVLPLDLYRSLRVSHVLDEKGKELSFIQEDKNEDADFGVILPEALQAGKTYGVTVQYRGADALRDSGGGNFILVPRLTWYPNNAGTQFGDRAIFDMTFRFPKGFTFVGTGAPVAPDTREGNITVAKWSSGKTELAVAGFNYGKFKKKEVADKDTGYNIEFYANQEVPDELKQVQNAIEQAESRGINTMTTLGSISTTSMANSAIADAENSTRIYNDFFGRLPYTRIAMTQQPAGFFGQAWPTLIFMPYTAFIDTTQRVQLFGIRGGTNNFWRYVAPHEIAHQWWGHIIGWDSYHDQWMSEGFAEFSASLFVQLTRGTDKFIDFWENQRKLIIESSPSTRDRKPYTVGPVTQGYRLNSGKTGNVARFLLYPKGAYILHMLRMMMYKNNGGDGQFKAMMRDLVQTYFNKDISTEDFKHIVEKHITREMDIDHSGKMDWFFNEWVYGTEIPSYRFDYQIAPDGTLSGRITQSGVSDTFAMIVPVYLDFGKGWIKLGTATLAGNSSVNLGNIKMQVAPKRAAICAMNDVLATSIQNSR